MCLWGMTDNSYGWIGAARMATHCCEIEVGITFMVTVFSIRALRAFKATCGHAVNDALPGARLTVFTAVREWKLQGGRAHN